ncbi:hypothetical protein L218DRAFT_736215 [Marasmius fiardii PR-910]|nr:hypothetical protein L218DRAFT_736215 [Marasmius fiardii PR-910]
MGDWSSENNRSRLQTYMRDGCWNLDASCALVFIACCVLRNSFDLPFHLPVPTMTQSLSASFIAVLYGLYRYLRFIHPCLTPFEMDQALKKIEDFNLHTEEADPTTRTEWITIRGLSYSYRSC